MSEILMGFVGDLLVNRENPDAVFEHVADALRTPDILFGNLEGAYTDDPHLVPGLAAGISGPANNLDVFARAGFNMMCLANNHILDVGYEAMLENRGRLRSQGVATCGVGENLDDARKPATLNKGGIAVAFLAYASVFPLGYEARRDAPGLAPMRAYDIWRNPNPRLHLPGTPPVVSTVPDQRDLANLDQDIAAARQKADLVIASFHWGDFTRPFHLTDHETRTARHCIDQGADMVVGHHHHAIRGMEWYRGKPIIYGLGHFIFDWHLGMTADELEALLLDFEPGGYFLANSPYITAPREGWPLLPMHEDMRMTMMAWARADKNGVRDIGFLPCRLNPDGSVRIVEFGTDECAEIEAYFAQCNATQRLNGKAVPDAVPFGRYQSFRVVPIDDR